MIRLSKREARYRTKLIQELHLKKPDQRRLDDDYMANLHATYKGIYESVRRGEPIQLRAGGPSTLERLERAVSSAARAFAAVGVSIKEAAEAFDRAAKAFTL